MNEKCEENLQYKRNDPGATRFGNFINYYQFNPPLNRIKNLPRDQWPDITKRSLVGLDLGCNAGVSVLNFITCSLPTQKLSLNSLLTP